MARAGLPGVFSFAWHRPAPVRIEVRERGPRSWTVHVDEGSDAMDLDAPPAPTVKLEPAAGTGTWHRAPHARLLEVKAEPPPVAPAVDAVIVAAAAASLHVAPDSKKRPHDEALPPTEAPAPKRHRADVAAALMPVQNLEALRQRFTKGANELNRYPHDDKIRLDTSDDPATGKPRHDYHAVIQGVDTIVKWMSVSKVKEHFYAKFDPFARAAKLASLTGRPMQSFLDEWALAAKTGTEKHRCYEAFLAWEDPWPAGVIFPPPQGFLRLLAAHPTWDIVRTELSLIDFGRRLVGQVDALFRCRETGKIKLVDFKHWKTAPTVVYTEDDTGLPERGCHPLTWQYEKSVLRETEVQLNFYSFILEQPENQYGVVVDEMLVWRFDPADTMAYQEYVIPRIDCAAYYAALVDPAPVPPPPPRAPLPEEPMPAGALDPAVPRPVPGPTTIVHVTKERIEAAEAADDVVWVGKKWASKTGEWALPDTPWKDKKSAYKRAKTPKELRQYERELVQNAELMAALPTLYGKQLACWCEDGACGCHAQVLRDYANAAGAAKM